jgi:hypothetical protein
MACTNNECVLLEAELDEYVDKNSELRAEANQLRAENERLKKSALDDARAEVAEHVWAIEAMQRDDKLKRDDLVEQVRSMLAENDRLKAQLERIREAAKHIHREYDAFADGPDQRDVIDSNWHAFEKALES